jgi:hypothetical protein
MKKIKLSRLFFFLFLIVFVILIITFGYFNFSNNMDDLDLSCPDCNIILFNLDLLRADQVGLINQGISATPNIDSFFSDGIIFTDASSVSGVSYANCVSVLTSTETFLNEHEASGSFLEEEGLMLIDRVPNIASVFDSHYSIFYGNSACGEESGLDGDFNESIFYGKEFDLQIESFLKSLSNVSEPFLIFLRTNVLHYPYGIVNNKTIFQEFYQNYDYEDYQTDYDYIIFEYQFPLRGRFVQVLDGPFNVSQDYEIIYELEVYGNKTFMNFSSYKEIQQNYFNQVRYADYLMKSFFDFYETNLANNTIFVFYSNHGDGLYQKGMPSHGPPIQQIIHVPFMMKHPKIDKLIEIKEPVTIVDILPTLADFLGIEINHLISGFSLNELIQNKENKREYIFAKFTPYEVIREDAWKLILTSRDNRLFNLDNDFNEINNVYEDNDKIAHRLESELFNYKKEMIDEFEKEYGEN